MGWNIIIANLFFIIANPDFVIANLDFIIANFIFIITVFFHYGPSKSTIKRFTAHPDTSRWAALALRCKRGHSYLRRRYTLRHTVPCYFWSTPSFSAWHTPTVHKDCIDVPVPTSNTVVWQTALLPVLPFLLSYLRKIDFIVFQIYEKSPGQPTV